MAKKVLVICDYDPEEEATEQIVVALNGSAWQLDVCSEHGTKIRETIHEIGEHGLVANVRSLSSLPPSHVAHANGTASEPDKAATADPAAVRAWAAANGVPCNDRGRVPEHVVAQYKKAMEQQG